MNNISRKLLAGNWKMYLNVEQAQNLTQGLASKNLPIPMILAVPYPYLSLVKSITDTNPNLKVAAQNVHQNTEGAFTGEVSTTMLASLNIPYSLVGHSERRQYFGETNAILYTKVRNLLDSKIIPIYCIGETNEEYESGKRLEVIENQLSQCVFHLNETDFSNVIIAYEPVWAIGTGKSATPEQAQEVHKFIRSLIAKKYNSNIAESTTILYGGSVKPENAKELFSQPDIDGGLVGGASLKENDFMAILNGFGL